MHAAIFFKRISQYKTARTRTLDIPPDAQHVIADTRHLFSSHFGGVIHPFFDSAKQLKVEVNLG